MKPKCTLTENPFTGPRFSWGLTVAYSTMITLIIGIGWYYTVGLSKSDEDENETKTSKDIVSGLTASVPISTEHPNLNRLAIKPFAV